MRTTITIDDHLLESLKRRAADRGTTVSRLIESCVRSALSPRSTEEGEEAFELITFGRGGHFTYLDVDKASRLLEREDRERHGPEGR